MAFVAGLLLMYMQEADAFYTLVALMARRARGGGEGKYALADLYSHGLPRFGEVMHVFSTLTRKFVPRLSAHFAEVGIDHTMYASQWFLTLFTYSAPFDLVTRVWDAFLCEGWKPVYRVAIAVLQLNETALLAMEFDALMASLKVLTSSVRARGMQIACRPAAGRQP